MINITLTEELKTVLSHNEIKVSDYTPAYGGESAGLDLFNAGSNVTIMPQNTLGVSEKVLINTGVKMIVPKGWVALVQERGSITKTPLKVRAGVIDSGYTGEVFVNLINTGNHEYTIKNGEKLPVQIVTVKCDNKYNIVEKEEYLNLSQSSERGTGKIGSSD